MAKSKSKEPEAPNKQSNDAAAFASIERQLAGVPARDVAPPKVDVESVVTAVLAVVKDLADPATHARFASLPKKEFDVACLDTLETLALAVRYAHDQLRSVTAISDEAKLPIALVEKATTVKTRMLRLCEYHFEDDPTLGREVADIRAGTGYLDLASDLRRLAKIYDDEHDLVDKDLKHYLATDREDALAYARDITSALGTAGSAAEKRWRESLGRAWRLLVETYDEIRETGLWLFRREVDRADRFPSLFVAGRPKVGKRKAGAKKAAGGASATPG